MNARRMRRIMQHRRQARGQRGAVLIEFALAAPVLLLLIFAALELGVLSWVTLTMRHALQDGVRQAVQMEEASDTARLLARVAGQSMGLYARLQPQITLVAAPGGHAVLRMECAWPVTTPLLAPFFPDGYHFEFAAALHDRGGE